jgi:hypothetical protein
LSVRVSGLDSTHWPARFLPTVFGPGLQCGSNSSAVLVQVKGWQRSFHPSMKFSMAAMRSLTEVKLPRRMAWRVMIEKKIRRQGNSLTGH